MCDEGHLRPTWAGLEAEGHVVALVRVDVVVRAAVALHLLPSGYKQRPIKVEGFRFGGYPTSVTTCDAFLVSAEEATGDQGERHEENSQEDGPRDHRREAVVTSLAGWGRIKRHRESAPGTLPDFQDRRRSMVRPHAEQDCAPRMRTIGLVRSRR